MRITEANNKPLFDRLRAIPAWKGIYRGKTDYLYYFLLLAAEKVRPGGRLCVITPAGWMNAGAADFLRARLAADLRLDELFLFGSYRLFTPRHGQAARRRVPTPTVESAILVATKARAPRNHSLRVVVLEDEVAAARALSASPEAKTPDRDRLLAAMAKRVTERAGRRDGIHVLRVKQAELSPHYPWPVKQSGLDVSSLAVAHLQRSLATTERIELLGVGWHVFQGVKTGADAFTRRIQRRLDAEAARHLEQVGARTGEPILELPAGYELMEPWAGHPSVLKRAPEPRAILYGALDEADYVNLLLLGSEEPAPAVLRHLHRWRPVLETRFDVVADPRKQWWEPARARSKQLLGSPKVIALHRTDRGRFALDEAGAWCPNIKATIVVGRSPNAPIGYLCGLLNSELLDLWYGVRGRTPRDVWRDYEPKRMNEIPYRRPDGDPRAEEIARLVRLIAANRRALLPHRGVAPGLVATVKDPWKSAAPAIARANLIATLPDAETVSVRLDARLATELGPPPLGRPVRVDARRLSFRRGRSQTGGIEGEPALLDLLESLLGPKVDDVGPVLLPKDLDAFEALVRSRSSEIGGLLAEGRRLVEEVERLVCALYEVPADLTDEVVEHAVRRAASTTPAPGVPS